MAFLGFTRTSACALLGFCASWLPGQVDREDPFRELQSVQETMAVKRVLLDVRVIDKTGTSVSDLTATDFFVTTADGRLPLTSCRWIGSSSYTRAEGEFVDPDTPLDDDAFWQDTPSSAPRSVDGRLIVFFMQGDVLSERRHGLMRMTQMAKRMIDELLDTDYCAVVSFFSHFKIHQDFTRNRSLVREALEEALFNQDISYAERGPFPSLVSNIDAFESRDIAKPEDAFFLLAEGLEGFEGNKSIVYLGWGLGRYAKGGVRMIPSYETTARQLAAARATVFAMDVTLADWHSLEVGMRQVAGDTGGFYVKTHEFANQAITKVLAAMSGYYEVSFQPPPGTKKLRQYNLQVGRKGVTVYTTPTSLW